MKNFEKHIDEIAEKIEASPGCSFCPCRIECFMDGDFEECHDFFKAWAMREVEENEIGD